MKITELKTYLVNNGVRGYVFLKMETDEGIHGWGEGTLESKERAVVATIHDMKHHVIGEDPTRIEYLWQCLRRHGFWRGGVVTNTALSAMDQALWDITGKAFGQPVYKLLGGACRDRIRCYCHGSASNVKEKFDEGWRAIKCGAGGVDAHGIFREGSVIPECVENLSKMRELVGEEMDIMVDAHGRFRPSMAVRLARAVEPFNLLFLEEPVPPDNVDAFAKLRDSQPSVDIATGERLFMRWGFRRLIEQQYVDVIQPDICHCGGISELRKIAAMAETYHLKVAPHNPNGPVATAASVHVAAAIPNFLNLETVVVEDLWNELVTEDVFRPQNSYLSLPTQPGLGIELNEDRLAAEGEFKQVPYRKVFESDGTPGDN
ncbi:MAG: galactonate dehydratase [Planctomycetota bacterium]|nr:galactonate dehydratase [Planctomycetota bacterium]MDA1142217.1 galactonate dehydratase [Planctomycetota bacterium]